MNRIELLRELAGRPTFNSAHFRSVTGEDRAYAAVHLWRLREAGHVAALRRDRFTVQSSPLSVASHVVWPSYISMWSALRHWELTEQVPRAVWVVTTRRVEDIEFRGTPIQFIRSDPRRFFGYTKVELDGWQGFMAEPEKALLDGLIFRRVPVAEIAAALSRSPRRWSSRKLASWALRLRSAALCKRVGYLMESVGADPEPRLLRQVDATWTPLDWSAPAEGRRDTRWRLVVNTR
ncbi:MAG TPA: hypothetical protein VI893_08340 [Thermoplasmata archaeon]|nr:hypothetical protein [Thermoplasmata archaeon]